MSLFANSYLYFQYLSQRHDLEMQSQVLQQRKFYLINVNSQLSSEAGKLDPGSEGQKVLELRVQQTNQMQLVVDAEIQRLQQQEQALSALMQSSKQLLNRDIQDSFTLYTPTASAGG